MFKTYFDKFKTVLTFRNSMFILLFFMPILITLLIFFSEDNDEFSQMGNTSYKTKRFSRAAKSVHVRVIQVRIMANQQVKALNTIYARR
jgi:hypothetical protein